MIPIVGERYIIKTYDKNPKFWAPSCKMMDWMGQIVTVTMIEDYTREWCKIREDGGRWSWKFENLELEVIDFDIGDMFEL